MSETWEPAKFSVAQNYGIDEREGYVFRGLGIFMVLKASPKGRRPPWWALIHLNTGHRVAVVVGDVQTAFPIAYEVAMLSDWDAFSSIRGWQNTDPSLREKLEELAERFPKHLELRRGSGSDETQACAIAAARAA